MKHDPHDPWSETSTTPFWDLAVVLCTLAGGLGGGLAAIYAVGYFMTDQPSLAWPLVGTVTVVLAVNVALRYGRRVARRRSW